MDALLYQHGCENSFRIPDGLRELMSDITREVLRNQPPNIPAFIAKYLSCLLITREHGMIAVKIVEDLCECHPTLTEELFSIGMTKDDAKQAAAIIREEIKSNEPMPGKERALELVIIKRVMNSLTLQKKMRNSVKCIIKKTFRGYWYRKKMLEQSIEIKPEEPWSVAAERTLQVYKRTKPSFTELSRATEQIQAAYSSYHLLRPETLMLVKARKAGRRHIYTVQDSYEDYFGFSEGGEKKSQDQRFIERFIHERKKAMVIKSEPIRPLFKWFLLDEILDDEEPEEEVATYAGSDTMLKIGALSTPSSACEKTHLLGVAGLDETAPRRPRTPPRSSSAPASSSGPAEPSGDSPKAHSALKKDGPKIKKTATMDV